MASKRAKWNAPWWVWPASAVGKRLDQLSNRELNTISVHPASTGVGRHPRIRTDEEWLNDCRLRLAELGPGRFFKGWLALLQASMYHYYVPRSEGIDESDLPPLRLLDEPAKSYMAIPPAPAPTADPTVMRKVFERGNMQVLRDLLDEPDDGDGYKAAASLICNPVYYGVPPFPRMRSDDDWLKMSLRFWDQGPAVVDKLMVNALECLRHAFGAPGRNPPRDVFGYELSRTDENHQGRYA